MTVTEAATVERLIIVGASLAGLRAAEAARAAGFTGELVVIGDEPHHPYERPALSKQCLIYGHEVPALRESEILEQLDARWLRGHPATGLDTSRKEVLVGDEKIPYTALVIATGAKPRTLPGLPAAEGIVTLRDADDVSTIREALLGGKRVTIIGAGIIGAEIATAARMTGSEVTIIEATEYPLERALGRHLGLLLAGWHEQNGVQLHLGRTVADVVVTHNNRVTSVTLDDGSVVPTDLLLVSIGVVPATGWLEGSGVELAPDGSVLCDEFLQTSVPGVYAAGDVAAWPNAQTGRTGRLETWTSANEQGATAGENAIVPTDDRRAYTTVPYFWSDWYGHRIQFVGEATASTPEVVLGDVDRQRFVALFEKDGRVVGALAVDEPSKIMKDRRRIKEGVAWEDALAVYREMSAAVGA